MTDTAAPILAGPTAPADSPNDQLNRTQQCWADIQAALVKHRCKMQSAITVEGIGDDRSKTLVSAQPMIVPLS